MTKENELRQFNQEDYTGYETVDSHDRLTDIPSIEELRRVSMTAMDNNSKSLQRQASDEMQKRFTEKICSRLDQSEIPYEEKNNVVFVESDDGKAAITYFGTNSDDLATFYVKDFDSELSETFDSEEEALRDLYDGELFLGDAPPEFSYGRKHHAGYGNEPDELVEEAVSIVEDELEL